MMSLDQISSSQRHPLLSRTLQAAIPATCGELVQGSLGGVPCLVSCPIERYSVANLRTNSTRTWELPAHLPKLSSAFRLALTRLPGAPKGGVVSVQSDLPAGRGYGSSTADIGAALFALGKLSGGWADPYQVARLAVQVEPTDSSLFNGLVLFDHRTASFYESFGAAPELMVLVIDPGGSVDTLSFNQKDHRDLLQRLAPDHKQAFNLLRSGLRQRDMQAVGEAATLSSRLHQSILYNPLLETALDLARQVRAVGVCRAHSGTLLGLLMDAESNDLDAVLRYVRSRLPADVDLSMYPLTGGGPRYPSRQGKEKG